MARVGRKVGNGQCATLAVRALAAAGARSMGRDAPAPGDYAWGKPVARIAWNRGEVAGLDGLADIRPGDIIQFRDARFAGRASGGGNYWMTAMHHTAVVASADPVAMTLVAYHQNWGKKIVGKDLFRCADLKSGWLRIYRAIPTR